MDDLLAWAETNTFKREEFRKKDEIQECYKQRLLRGGQLNQDCAYPSHRVSFTLR